MKFYGKGTIWDAENDRILCKFKDGEFETEDVRTIKLLADYGFKYEGELPEIEITDLKVAELKERLDEKGIEYDAKAKRDELIELLKGAE